MRTYNISQLRDEELSCTFYLVWFLLLSFHENKTTVKPGLQDQNTFLHIFGACLRSSNTTTDPGAMAPIPPCV